MIGCITYITLLEVLNLHDQILQESIGASGIRDLGALESAIAQPYMTFGGQELYPTTVDKAAAIGFSIGFSIVMSHPFIDGNKRTGHAVMEIFLVMNNLEISASVDEQERVILALASGELSRETFTNWLQKNVKVLTS